MDIGAQISAAQDCVSQITNGVGQVTGMQSAVNGAFQNVMGGAWTGKGAQAFENAVTSELLPAVANLIAALTGFGGAVNAVVGVIQQADQMATNPVGAIEDAIGGVPDFLGL